MGVVHTDNIVLEAIKINSNTQTHEKHDLVVNNMDLVYSICWKHFKKASEYHDFEDIISAGMEGLVYAANRFKPEKGFEFSTFAYPTIVGIIRRYLRDDFEGGIRVSRGKRSKGVVAQIRSLNNKKAFKKESMEYQDMISTEQDFTSVNVEEFISKLPEKEEKICRLLFSGLIQKEIGKEIGLTQAQVSRLKSKIRDKYIEYAFPEGEGIFLQEKLAK